MNEARVVEVHIEQNLEPPGGMGEAGTSAIVPAVANAIFAATGKRLRKMPVDPDTLFNKRDYKAAEAYWSPKYIQHSAHIPPGREGLFGLVKSLPAGLRYEHGPVVAEGDFVFIHGRFSGIGQPRALITIDIVRFEDGVLAEHWDVWQDEVSAKDSKSGLPMFGEKFPD